MSMTDLDIIRHTLATLAYRASKTMRTAPEAFAHYKAGSTTKTPVEIVAHMGDQFDWALSMAIGEPKWNSAVPQEWQEECKRFFVSLKKFDDYLASELPTRYELTRLFQGPIADALTHTGQLAMLRRMYGAPMKGESYNRADIVIGRVGYEQTRTETKNEFD
ncbi:MAG: hypothetical protein WBP29_13200 [Candidatus Zixiibacteriota bacterium]